MELHLSSPLCHDWNDNQQAAFTHSPTAPQSKSGSGVWKQWSEFKPPHVFLKRVSGNGNASKIKKGERRRRREGGNDETLTLPSLPPFPSTPREWNDCTWCFFFFFPGRCLSSKSKGGGLTVLLRKVTERERER